MGGGVADGCREVFVLPTFGRSGGGGDIFWDSSQEIWLLG